MRRLTEEEVAKHFWARLNKTDTCWLWKPKSGNGKYGVVTIHGVQRTAHRVAWELANGPIPNALMVCHKCDVPLCCNPDHLFLGTNADNQEDARRKGRMAMGDRSYQRLHPEKLARGDRSGARMHPETLSRGSNRPDAKLTEADIIPIKDRFASGEQCTSIARHFGVSRHTITRVITGTQWKHVS